MAATRKAGGTGLVLGEIRKCSCSHLWQDAKYGLQRRLHRAVPEKIGKGYTYRCTVCESTRAQNRTKLYIKQQAGAVGRLG